MASPLQAGFLEKVVVISSSMVYECCDSFPSKDNCLGYEMVDSGFKPQGFPKSYGILSPNPAGGRLEILPSTVPCIRMAGHWGREVKPMGWRRDNSPGAIWCRRFFRGKVPMVFRSWPVNTLPKEPGNSISHSLLKKKPMEKKRQVF